MGPGVFSRCAAVAVDGGGGGGAHGCLWCCLVVVGAFGCELVSLPQGSCVWGPCVGHLIFVPSSYPVGVLNQYSEATCSRGQCTGFPNCSNWGLLTIGCDAQQGLVQSGCRAAEKTRLHML